MQGTTIWFFCFLGMMTLTGVIIAFLTLKKIKYLNIVVASLVGITLFLAFELLFYLDQPEDINQYFRIFLAPVSGIGGFIYFLLFMYYIRPNVRKGWGLEDDKNK